MTAPAPGSPIRVIYAKLTSTGAYDVVARTANIPLDRARSLAERLLPGNPPLDANVGTEVAHLRPPEGGHVVMRFARYDWADGDRGDVYITDIAWYADADFARARCNAFALVPHTSEVFHEQIELPPFTVSTPGDDFARLSALRGAAADAKTVVASAAAADPLLLIHAGERAAAMELFTLLLPPRLRAQLTFQTAAFRVPAMIPRVTLVDRGHANLREGAWKVLPNLDVDVPLELAGRFVALADDPAALEQVHALYDDAFEDAPDMRTGITRIVALAPVAAALREGDTRAVIQALGAGDARIRAAALRRLTPAATAELIDTLPAGAPTELVVELANLSARQGDVPRLLHLIGLDRRAITPRVDVKSETVPPEVRAVVQALRDCTGPRHDLDSAAQLLRAAAEANARVRGTAAADSLHRMCRDALGDAVERTSATVPAVDAMLRLREAADSYMAEVSGAGDLPPIVAPYEMQDGAASQRAADAYGAAPRAVLGAAMLDRATAAHAAGFAADAQMYVQHAVTLLTAAGQPGRELARQLLHARTLQEHDLVSLPGSTALLPLLGGNAQQAALTHGLVAALNRLAGGDDAALQDLVVAVVAAHAQRVRIVAGTELSRGVIASLSRMKAAPPVVDVVLELLTLITEPAHVAEIEDAALGDSMAQRLQRLDRSVAMCRAVEREDRYERYARAVESADVPLTDGVRERLRDALGTRGLQRRLMRAVSSVVERDAS